VAQGLCLPFHIQENHRGIIDRLEHNDGPPGRTPAKTIVSSAVSGLQAFGVPMELFGMSAVECPTPVVQLRILKGRRTRVFL
jgi:hypothetical protein